MSGATSLSKHWLFRLVKENRQNAGVAASTLFLGAPSIDDQEWRCRFDWALRNRGGEAARSPAAKQREVSAVVR
jgi:hypothetical protein